VNDILLQIEGLSKRFGGVEAVAGVSFHVGVARSIR
jgi:ABC-type branched-subunit amino acid transport system ATPase component